MAEISRLAQEIASAVVIVTHEDLPALAVIHSQLQELRKNLPADLPDLSTARETTADAEHLVEQIVLREVSDAEAAIKQLGDSISSLLKMIEPMEEGEATGIASSPASAAPLETAKPAPARSALDLPEDPLNPSDLPLVSEFITEALSHIESAEAALLELETSPGNPESINTIFRGFHTIKGVAGFLNLKSINALAHAAESLLDLGRQGKLRIADTAVDVVLDTIDLMKEMMASLAETVKSGGAPVRPARLAGLLERLALCSSGNAAAAPAKETPAPAVRPQSDSTPPSAPPAATPSAPDNAATPAGSPALASPAAAKSTGESTTAQPAESVVKVSTDRLDSLINAIGELVIAQSMVRQDLSELAAGNHRVARNLNHLGKIARELQDLSMSMRMVPINGVFQKMTRLVRDVARKAGKEIELVQVGGDTELDRNLVEAISDPLVHMVRNAGDHGIEPPDVREKAGKPRVGKIQLKAYHAAGHIVIEISDDGRGLAKAKILKKAVAAGLVAPNAELSDAEIFKLIFHAGLSTAEKVTDISGRGVGMDVVRKNVEALRGRIDITSVEGRGSTFTIRLPLTLAVIDGLLVKVGDARFILPILSVEQSVRPTADQLSSVQGRGEMCMVRQSLLPLYRLHKLLNVKPKYEDPTQALVVIVQDDARRCCLLIDELLGQQQVVIKSLGDGVGHVRGVSGGAILGDGNVSLILDVPGLLDLAAAKERRNA